MIAGGDDGRVRDRTVVEKAYANTLIPLLKAHGATDVLGLPISRIGP
jgi:hypothetical protein